MNEAAQLQRDGEVWTVSLARPDKRNALSAPLVEALIDLVQRAPAEGAKVIVFRGEGRNFSAGFDFADVEQQSEGDLLLRFVRLEMLLQAIGASPCLTVALAHGRTFGAGVDIIASCRQRYGTADSSFRMPGLKFGLVLGTRRFGEIVGREQASSLQEEAATFDATRALEMNFLHGIVEQADWPGVVQQARTRAAALPEWSRHALYEVLASREADTDLAWLVRSAARPGLQQRIADYLRPAQEK
ncbi:MAG: enoyl-CoA hydratase/isomerase family protein [Gammaproteobacteria bacterium]|nr:enoyl-CoA hydratase/isomerase family protein [Gammaproteobacteria bacterium]MBU1442380.1 enoyl-CoA hydratase/isomerase family protein [Gammaproteobacteria bacterium]